MLDDHEQEDHTVLLGSNNLDKPIVQIRKILKTTIHEGGSHVLQIKDISTQQTLNHLNYSSTSLLACVKDQNQNHIILTSGSDFRKSYDPNTRGLADE